MICVGPAWLRSMGSGVFALAASVTLVLGSCGASGNSVSGDWDVAGAAARSGSEVPAGLPQHLGIGLKNSPGQLAWMTSSGVSWDYRYQYLTGGVNTGEGWVTWNDPPGSFVDVYLDGSGENGYVPVLTYYQIVASAPDPWDEDVFPKLQSASTMQAYYGEWKLLMEKAGAYGEPVVVHVEPDVWGYMQVEYGEDGNAVPVKVGSSGYGEVAGYADTAAGFAQALVHLRDVYGPNVVLAFHASTWATGEGLTLGDGDPVGIADDVAAFYQSLGASFDLIFIDPSDRDAAYYEIIHGDGGAHWWEGADFERFGVFVGRVVEQTGRRAMLWQVPVGNGVYRSMNNSQGHYQDNRAEYWLGERAHLEEYADLGVIAVLFGAGAYGCTMYTDEMGDGITNPLPINGNVLSAVYADDDGGYLRLQGAQYYREGPVPLPGSPAPDDSDGDGCVDSRENSIGLDPLDPYDFYDVPVPARADPAPNGSRNTLVDMGDALAVSFYLFSEEGGPPNANGVSYDSDKGNDTDGDTVADVPPDSVPDGLGYDRSPGQGVDPVTGIDPAGPPDGVVDVRDFLAVLAQFGVDCSDGS